MIASGLRLLRTVRHLRPRQLAAQIRHRLPRRGPRIEDPDEASPDARWRPDAFPAPTGEDANDRAAILAGRLSFAGAKSAVGFPPAWDGLGMNPLWRYNLHYHDFLWELTFAEARAVVLDWIAHRPGPGWAPYPTSLRLVNWCALFYGRHAALTGADEPLRQTLWASIRAQARHLERNLEWHLLGNHLLENAVALAVVGSCFDHPAAERWLDKGRALLERELAEQFLPDGGHVERSPMYQCRVVHDLRVLAATAEPRLVALAAPRLEAATRALGEMTHPDGDIALLNDSAFGIYPKPDDVPAPDRPRAFALDRTGYFGARTPDGDYVICDAAPMGPDYQPGHGHADLFSFELSFGGRRVVVDSGVFGYDAGPCRDYCRATRAHNAVEIEGESQAELWGAFRVGRRPRPRAVLWDESAGGFTLSGEHDGYGHLPGSPRHRRCFAWRHDGRLVIEDRIASARPVDAVARLHLHPACRIEDLGPGRCTVRAADASVAISWQGWQAATVDASTYCPRFGVAQPNRCLALAARVAILDATIRLEKR